MWEVTEAHLEALAIGCGILGTGGGGNPYIGKLEAREQLRQGKTIRVIGMDELPDDAFATTVGGMGAPTVSVERVHRGDEPLMAMRALERHLGRQFSHVLPGEIGGANGMQPMVVSGQTGLPVVDGDGMGRAFPELQMDTFTIYGVRPTPGTLCDPRGHTAVFYGIDEAQTLERYARVVTIQMGGAAGMGLATGIGCNRAETRALVAAGAGAGIAAAFNAPIAGALFVIEELRRASPYSFGSYHAVLIASIASTFVTEAIAGVGPELRLTIDAPSLAQYPLFIALGVALGAGGAVFNRLVLLSLDVFGAWSRRAPTSLVLVLALGLTALLYTMPQATGGGEQIIPSLTAMPPEIGALLLLLVLRCGASLASYAAGAPGGIFAPILALATVAGLAFAEAAHMLLPGAPLEPTAAAAAAMAALFTGSVRAPLVGVVLVAELTDAYPAILAITLSSAMASLTAAALGGRPLYEELLERTLRLAR